MDKNNRMNKWIISDFIDDNNKIILYNPDKIIMKSEIKTEPILVNKDGYKGVKVKSKTWIKVLE